MFVHVIQAIFTLLLLVIPGHALAAERQPVRIGLDGEFGLTNSTSAQSIERGIRTALDEVNRAGGVLGGRMLELVTKDHRSMPARGIKNIREFAEIPELVAVFGGRFSPVVIEELPTLKETKTLFLAPWSSADAIVENGMDPNYIFRLSLHDSLAMCEPCRDCRRLQLLRDWSHDEEGIDEIRT